jgi:hypothetical protein
MDSAIRKKLIKQRAFAKASLTRMQNFIETGDRKLNDIQVRFEELPRILDKFEPAQNELECFDDTDYSGDRESFGEQYYQVKAKFNELLHPADIHSSPDSFSEHSSNSTPSTHSSSALIKLPVT